MKAHLPTLPRLDVKKVGSPFFLLFLNKKLVQPVKDRRKAWWDSKTRWEQAEFFPDLAFVGIVLTVIIVLGVVAFHSLSNMPDCNTLTAEQRETTSCYTSS